METKEFEAWKEQIKNLTDEQKLEVRSLLLEPSIGTRSSDGVPKFGGNGGVPK